MRNSNLKINISYIVIRVKSGRI